MILLVVITLAVTILSYIFFIRCRFTTENFAGKMIPYCLGVPVIVSFLLSLILFSYTETLSAAPIFYVFSIWLTGLLDDRFGSKQPKGFKGHFRLFFQKGKVSTGLLKIGVTSIATIGVLVYAENISLFQTVVIGFLLLLTPHVMNLFDTRPLRTLKVSFIYFLTLVPFFSLAEFRLIIFTVLLMLLLGFFEAKTLAMLGDNGATTIGAVLALITIYYSSLMHQVITLIVWGCLTLIAEKLSFSKVIERFGLLKTIDVLGNPTKK